MKIRYKRSNVADSFVHKWNIMYKNNIYNPNFLGDSVSSCHSHRHIARTEKAFCIFSCGYEVDLSENNFDEKVTAPNLKDSDSDNSGSDAGREKEVMRAL